MLKNIKAVVATGNKYLQRKLFQPTQSLVEYKSFKISPNYSENNNKHCIKQTNNKTKRNIIPTLLITCQIHNSSWPTQSTPNGRRL